MHIKLPKYNPDNDILNDLWGQSFNIRGLCVRELSIDEILERFPAYRRPELILAEVKDTVGVDINTNTNHLLPHFFDCIPDNGCFLSENNENTLSSSDDEEDPSRLSIATPPIPTVENERSRAIRETASTPLVTMKKLSNNTKSTKSTSISSSKKLASAHQQENAVDKIQQSKKHHSTGYTKT
ncbi:unnamed protein product [Rotaria socialis]|uniref:Uncharacterized protein n=1 Tax=Rotaria socialis TaxID=392032 RepID=A0A818K2X4_9BILA|nr:unnamed protein product [Rotaria socialis]CAF3548708.1 unnamed protein product [Rotaria socialis]